MADSIDHTDKNAVGRRDFFRGAALGTAGLVVTNTGAEAEAPPLSPARPAVILPTEAQEFGYADAPAGGGQAPAATAAAPAMQPASDFMVDVLKKIGLRVRRHQPGLDVPGSARIAASTTATTPRRSC